MQRVGRLIGGRGQWRAAMALVGGHDEALVLGERYCLRAVLVLYNEIALRQRDEDAPCPALRRQVAVFLS